MNYKISAIKLYPHDRVLTGKYPVEAGIVLVEFYSDNEAFSVQLPDLFSIKDYIFILSNAGSNTVTLTTTNGQNINTTNTLSYEISANQTKQMFSNNSTRLIIF